jgi:hypothetical protein
MHCWYIIEQPNGGDGLTDLEILQIYSLISHGSAPYHRTIAAKLKHTADLAQHNLRSIHTWENEGGYCGTPQTHNAKQNDELCHVYGSTPVSG